MSAKLKPNFTPVPNVIFDDIMSKLTPSALKVLLAICRYTYGWGKQSDRISSNQLAEMTGMDRSNVRRSLKQLQGLVIVKPGDPKENQASEYQLNINISDADLVSLRPQGPVSPGHQPGVRPGVTSAPIQIKPKKEDISAVRKGRDRTPDPRVKILINAFAQKYLEQVGKPYRVTGGKDGALLKSILTAGYDVDSVQNAMDRYFTDKFHVKTGFDVGRFSSAFASLVSAGAKKKLSYREDYPDL